MPEFTEKHGEELISLSIFKDTTEKALHEKNSEIHTLEKSVQEIRDLHKDTNFKVSNMENQLGGIEGTLKKFIDINRKKEDVAEKEREELRTALATLEKGDLKVLKNNDTKQWALLVLVLGGLLSSVWFMNKDFFNKKVTSLLGGIAYAQEKATELP